MGEPTAAGLVTLGESLARLENPVVGPLRHARTLDLGVAGAESNVAIGYRRLGGTSCWIGRLGDDEFGRLIQMTLAGQGVDVRHAMTDPAAPTALLIKERRTGSLTRVQYLRAGSAGSRLCPSDVPSDVVRNAEILHVTGITVALSQTARQAVHAAVDTARRAGVPVSLDLNYRAALWDRAAARDHLRPLIARADIVFATEPEARLIAAGPPARDGATPGATPGADAAGLATAIAALGPREVLVKRGPAGVAARCDGDPHEHPAVPVAVVDPVGAGDAFAAAYLAERVRGRPVPERLAAATAAGAYAVTVAGDWEGFPTRADLALLHQADDEVLR